MRDIVVIGGGGHAKVLLSVLKRLGYRILGYTDNMNRGTVLGAAYLGSDLVLSELKANNPECEAVIGVGKMDSLSTRSRLLTSIGELGFEFPVICSPHALINEAVTMSSGSVAIDGVVVNTGAVIGRACILNTNCTVEHDCTIGDNVHVAPGAIVCGGTRIGNDCMIGAGATVIQSIRICDGCLIGAGTIVTSDITSRGTYVGNPARRIR